MAGPIVDYASLVQAALDFTHRGNLLTYIDELIQQAQAQIESDIPIAMVGSYTSFQEAPYPPFVLSAAEGTPSTAPVPSDLLAFKLLTVSGLNRVQPLIQKNPTWLYQRFPGRIMPQGMPQYVAIDSQPATEGWVQSQPSQAIGTSAGVQTYALSSTSNVILATLDGASLTPGTDYTVTGASISLTSAPLAGQTLVVYFATVSLSIPSQSAGYSLIFGPSPDMGYTIEGTYYQRAAALNSGNTTNWMVTYWPQVLFAQLMVQAGLFIPDDGLISRWAPLYAQRLKAACNAERQRRVGDGPSLSDVF